MNDQERILCAACWVDTGKVAEPRRSHKYPETGVLFCGWRHSDCFVTLDQWAALLPKDELERIGERKLYGNQGFLTNKGRFVDRYEAFEIAKAADQIWGPSSHEGKRSADRYPLTSEDLY